MTISPKTIERMRSMKDEGYTQKEIASKFKVSVRTVGKKLKEDKQPMAELVNSQNQQHLTAEKSLEKQFQILELKPKVQNQLSDMVMLLEDERPNLDKETGVVLSQLWFLWNKIEETEDVEVVKWVQGKISEGSELSKKFYDYVNKYLKKVEEEAAVLNARQEREKIRREEKQNRRFQRLRRTLRQTIEGVNDLLTVPFNEQEKEQIIQQAIPSRTTTYDLAKRNLRIILDNYLLKKDQIAAIIDHWYRLRLGVV